MTDRRLQHSKGVSLIEVMIAMVVLVIIALGALSYQYYAALHARAALSGYWGNGDKD